MINYILYNGVSVPPDAQFLLSRPQLDSLLLDTIKKPLTTVVAGAGYGKTQAVSSVLFTTDNNVIWMQLTELDNLADRVWERFIYALEPFNTELSKSLATLGYPDSVAAFHQFLKLLASEFEKGKRFIIVLDDFHFIHEQPIIDFFEHIITAHLENLSIVLISRVNPQFSLAAMLSRGILTRITQEELRFSKEEMESYYQKQNIHLSRETIDIIYSYTEGWVFAIYLIGLATKKEGSTENDLISLAKSDIFSLIEKEVFAETSAELQDFLIDISILDTVPVGMLSALSDNNPGLVSKMTEISLLIRYDSFSDSYRLHNLFKDFLLEKSNLLSEERIARIHYIAGKWYEDNDYKVDAIAHYRYCNRYNEIFDIILSVRQRVSKEIADAFIELIESAPQDLIEARPIISVVKANYLFNNNRIPEAKAELERIQKQYEALPSTKENRAILGEAYITLGLISIVEQNYEFEVLFKKAAKCLPSGSVLVDYSFNIAEGLNVTGIKNPVPGELQRYQAALFAAAPYISKVMNGCGYGMEYLSATDVEFMNGNLGDAEKYAYETYYRALERKQYGIMFMANFYFVRIYTSKGDYEKIADILKRMQEQLSEFQNAECLSLYDIIEGWFFVKIGQTSKVAKWIMDEEETRKKLAPVVVGREYLVRSDCLLAQNKYYELLAFMEQQDKLYESRGLLYALIQNKITKAVIYYSMSDNEKSMAALNEAYILSNPNNLVMQYIEYGSKMRTLINTARQDSRCIIPKDWLDNIYTKSTTYAKMLGGVLTGYSLSNGLMRKENIHLSKGEHEVLVSLCNGLTREEIAVECGLSVNTVKSVLQSIFNKLGAMNSIDAVRTATLLDLI